MPNCNRWQVDLLNRWSYESELTMQLLGFPCEAKSSSRWPRDKKAWGLEPLAPVPPLAMSWQFSARTRGGQVTTQAYFSSFGRPVGWSSAWYVNFCPPMEACTINPFFGSAKTATPCL